MMAQSMINASKKPKPFLKWAGGKSRIASEIASYFPKKYNNYYEPFLGSGAIYFEIAPQQGVLNDLNKNLIDTYQSIKETPKDLIKRMSQLESEYNTLKSLEEKANYFYKLRDEYNHKSLETIQKSAIFIFLNKAGWNGMYRENSAGDFNIPFGKREKIKIFDEDNILAVSANIQKMKFTSLDYKEAVKDAKKDDLIYFDPPYFPLTKTASFTDYQKTGFTKKDQEELHDLANELRNRGCFVVISNSCCPDSTELYRDFHIQKIEISRTISAKASSRSKIKEIIAMSYKKWATTHYKT